MAIIISPDRGKYVAEVTPPDGQWRTPHPMTAEELAMALKGIGCDQSAASDAFQEAILLSYRDMAEELSPQVMAALNGEREVPKQSPYTEAWLTYVLFEMNQPITIPMLIEDADSLNHLIPTSDEVSWTLVQLKKRGWLLAEGVTFALTPEGRIAVERIARGRNVWERQKRLEEWISSHPYPDNE